MNFDVAAARKRCLGFRRRILDLSQKVSALHIASAFSCLELVDAIYFGLLRRNGDKERDDTFLLSKGHGAMALYVVLEELGILGRDQLDSLCKPGWPLATHPDYGLPGIEASTGSLGHGLALALGMAYADRIQGKDRNVYVIMSDGELMEGSVWEAIMVAPSLGVSRLVVLVDLNDSLSLGQISKVLPNFYPVLEKGRSFGWETLEVNGHDAAAAYQAITLRNRDKPLLLFARTVKGKGVGFMENVPIWHYRSPNPQEYQQAISELREITT